MASSGKLSSNTSRKELMNRYSREIGREYYNKICSQKDRQPHTLPRRGSKTDREKFYSRPTTPEVQRSNSNGNSDTSFLCREIPRELEKYYQQIKFLKSLLAETRASFDQIHQFGFYEFERQTSPLNVIENEDFGIAETLTKPASIVILGQDNVAKATLVRTLFGEELIPPDKVDEDLELQRVVRFSFGRKQDFTVTNLPRQNVSTDDYVIIDPDSEVDGEDAEFTTGSESDDSSDLSTSSKSDTKHDDSLSFHSAIHKNIRLKSDERLVVSLGSATLEVQLPHTILKTGGEVLVGPCNNPFMTTADLIKRHISGVFPIILYGLTYHKLSRENIRELQVIRELRRDIPIFFIKAYDDRGRSYFELTESAQYDNEQMLRMQLIELGFLQLNEDDKGHVIINDDSDENECFSNKQRNLTDSSFPMHALARGRFDSKKVEVGSVLYHSITEIGQFVGFLVKNLRSHLANLSTLLHNTHTYVLKNFVSTAYELSRDCQITPRKIEYTKEKEKELYQALMQIANRQQNDLKQIIHETIHGTREEILKEAADFTLSRSQAMSSYAEVKSYETHIQNLVLTKINQRVIERMTYSTAQLNENLTGVLQRCLRALEENLSDRRDPETEFDIDRPAQTALKSILDAAYNIELPVPSENGDDHNSANFMSKMKDLFTSMTFKNPPPSVFTADWKMSIAHKLMSGLNETKLAKIVCHQFKNKVQNAHSQFVNAMSTLELRQARKLEKNEERRMQVRKNLAPKISRLAMESLSLRDCALFGMPKLESEIGRGQYGVVYSSNSEWGNHKNIAIKSLLPPDEKHWNDLSMEYYYTRSLPPHDRIVQIRGSVIDHNYGGGSGQVAALLIMDRYPRDLYSAIKSRLSYPDRLQVALDVVDGLRFLHSQGLVHRDIKLKNILLDEKNRGKITDLGFCKPEAMMSGSIVGTPIHMAPELLRADYDHSVDTYAFGILFWYVCAGTVKLPHNFEQCTSKEHLWSVVQRGIRPERLSFFEDDCWRIMSECWATSATNRPHLGYIRPRLETLVTSAFARTNAARSHNNNDGSRGTRSAATIVGPPVF